MSSSDGFEILKKWKTFQTRILITRSRSVMLERLTRVLAVSMRKRTLVLAGTSIVAGKPADETFDLRNANFRKLAPEEIPLPERERIVSVLEISFPDDSAILLTEELPRFTEGRLM